MHMKGFSNIQLTFSHLEKEAFTDISILKKENIIYREKFA